MSDRLSRIVDRLTRTIPDPPAPIARPTSSFATLKVGQHIVNNAAVRHPWLVESVDSLGAKLTCPHNGESIHFTDRNWKTTWSRVHPPRKRKATP